ncbi:Transposase DDE domain protein [Gemmata sp. SH-PL17]|uniref:ISAs1 family transposase n=1 Tax=Gemmata sp. SH-PL17 TaxID=1630693 RepID=UPI00078B524F|nr:ISAs1 family transposase [Gemmata sp. SH-PL17]AMV25856.1 Transposase DDE domain protein [Gemmata sp. SH-PL17]
MPDQELGFIRYFAALPDPRVNRTKKHALSDILGVTLCAVICGADSFEEIERFGEAREPWLKQYFALRNGIPSHDTFNRVLAALDRKVFAACFGHWMADLNTATGLKAIAIDGKACRAAPGDTFSGCLHLVSAWATENGLILGQEAVPDNGHEITTIPVLLKALDLTGAVVTIDAAGCQKAIVEQIREQGGDYVVTVKGNQQTLHRAVAAAFEKSGETEWAGCDMRASVEDGHGRHEERYVTVIKSPEGLPAGWTDVGAVVAVGRERAANGKNASTCHFYLTSLRGTAEELGGYVRGHWGVENGLHWCLDIAFREDENRTRDTNAGANLGVVRRVAASLLKQDAKRGSIKAKRLNAAWDQDYLKQILQGFRDN